jgi:hypothetical protein
MKKLNVKQIKEKVERLKAERSTWETHWQEIADYVVPRKSTVTTQKQQGSKRSVNVTDSTGIQSNELLAGALHGLLTNPNAFWFELTTGDVELDRQDDVRMFLQKATRDIHNVLNNSNFQTEIHELYIDLCSFGTASMYTEEDANDLVRFSTKFIAEYMIDEDQFGRVNQIYREWSWDATKLVAEFGLDKMPEKIKTSYEKQDGKKFCCIHAVYPRDMIDANNRSAFKWISQYVLPDENIELAEAGYREFPYIVPRWTKAAGEVYGRSPSMNALPEIKTINKMTETMIMGAQKIVDPPVMMPDDGFILPIVVTPGGINYYRSGTQDFIKPIFNDSRIDFGYQALDASRKRIREAYYVDQLQLQQGPQMTATEVLQRTEEKMRLLGPMLGRQQAELLRPLIDRVFAIMLRKGKIVDIPGILSGKKIDVRYSSLIAKSQRLAEGQNFMRFMEAVTPLANANNTVLDNLETDQAFRVVAEVYGAPQEVIRTQKDREQIRKQRADAQQAALEQQQQQQQMDAAPKMADTMQKLAGNGQAGGQ